jgi:hypothetical protein
VRTGAREARALKIPQAASAAVPVLAEPESAQDGRELQPQEISTLLTLTESLESTDEGLELIEMRSQQMLALMNLEDLFAEGQLDGM